MKLSLVVTAALAACILFTGLSARAQWAQDPATGSEPNRVPDRTIMAGQSGLGPLMTAKLLDKTKNAREHQAVIQVQTDSIQMTDPVQANHAPRRDQAHIQYQMDSGTPINNTSKTWKFQNLSSGDHYIHVTLTANDNRPVGEATTLKLHVP